MRFLKGDIITGNNVRRYAITNHNALMVVTNSTPNHMDVIILCHDSRGYISANYTVDNDGRYFKETTLEDFISLHPHCYKMENNEMEKLLEKYKIQKIKKSENAYILSDEMRSKLLEEMRALLTKYHYNPTDKGLNKILDEWCSNKADLIRLFEKHPNYNGKFQITFDYDFDRSLDKESISEFADWLISDEVRGGLLKEIKLGAYTYSELIEICDRLYNFYRLFERHSGMDIKTINGKTYNDFKKEYLHFNKFKTNYEERRDLWFSDNKAYDRKSYDIYTGLNRIHDSLNSSYADQFVNETIRDYLNRYFPNAKLRKGQKTSRAINKILCEIGIDKLSNYNKKYAKFSDAINPLKIKRHTVISIHPIDYLTMSFGNSWSSCHTIDKKNDRGIDNGSSYRGCNSSGTMSYMLDETSCVFYTVDSEYDGGTLELENKINRCMFHYYDNRLVQGRVYPQSNDNGLSNIYKDIREIVQKVFSDMLEVPNYWSNVKGTDACDNCTSSTGTHYKDYINYDNCNVSTLKDDREKHDIIYIGHYPICPRCGKLHDRTRNIECYDCNKDDK